MQCLGHLLLQPDRIPMGILFNALHQVGSQGIGNQIAGNLLDVFFFAQGMIIKTALPDRAPTVQVVVEIMGGSALEEPHYFGK